MIKKLRQENMIEEPTNLPAERSQLGWVETDDPKWVEKGDGGWGVSIASSQVQRADNLTLTKYIIMNQASKSRGPENI
jgi:hypothetical protein